MRGGKLGVAKPACPLALPPVGHASLSAEVEWEGDGGSWGSAWEKGESIWGSAWEEEGLHGGGGLWYSSGDGLVNILG